MLQVGADIDGFLVEAFLGEGAMATVWKVREVASGERFALKVMARSTRQPLERFHREAAVQTRIRHPNVIAVHRLVEVGEHPALLMELVEGLPLDRLLLREVPDARVAEQLFLQICAGVEAAHAAGIVHRDLKPSNVMVGNLGGLRVAKVGDFGLVRILGDSASPRLTIGTNPLGTPGYMAPEQATSARDADERSDIFSLGCILYRMLCGRPPFGEDLREAWHDLSRGLYRPPFELVPELDPRLASTIAACLRVDPAQRPQEVAAVIRMLGRPRSTGLANPGGRAEPVQLADLVMASAPPAPPDVRSVQPSLPPTAAPPPAAPTRRNDQMRLLLLIAAFGLAAATILGVGVLWAVLG